MSVRSAALALVAAMVGQSALGMLAPGAGRVVDLLLIVVVYVAVTRGEVAGLVAGTVAGWLIDAAFGVVLGLSALPRQIVGWCVGAAGARLMLAGVWARLLVLVAATLADARLLEWFAAGFGVDVQPLAPQALATRAALNAILGVTLFAWLDRRLMSETVS